MGAGDEAVGFQFSLLYLATVKCIVLFSSNDLHSPHFSIHKNIIPGLAFCYLVLCLTENIMEQAVKAGTVLYIEKKWYFMNFMMQSVTSSK